MRPAHLLLLTLSVAIPGCTGNLGDIFGAFPEELFQPDDGGGGGIPPGGPGGAFQAQEVAFLAGAQGVTGDVRNIALAQVGAQTLAFLAAGTDGCHMVDVTEPELVNSTSYLTSIRDAVLTAPAAIAGGRVDALAVVDNTYLVCVAVATGAPNAVTVFHIPTLLAAATSPAADLSGALLPGTGAIAVPGNGGKGAGVSGAAGFFAVATGGAALGLGAILPGTPGTWTALPAFTSATAPTVDSFVNVLVNVTAIYASVTSGDTFGIIALNFTVLPAPAVTVATPEVIGIEGNFDLVVNDIISGPGNFPLDLALDATSLFVTAENEVHIFNITNPVLPAPLGIAQRTGIDTIAVTGSGGFFAIGSGDAVSIYSLVTGQPLLAARLDFDAGFFIRGVALHSSARGRFALCCSGGRGLRIVQWSDIP